MFVQIKHIIMAYLTIAALFAGTIASIHHAIEKELSSPIGYVTLGMSWPLMGGIMLLNSISGFPLTRTTETDNGTS